LLEESHGVTFQKMAVSIVTAAKTWDLGSGHWLRLALAKGCGRAGLSLSHTHTHRLKTERDPVFQALCFLIILNYGRRSKSINPEIRVLYITIRTFKAHIHIYISYALPLA
jgi:hypothetical protein